MEVHRHVCNTPRRENRRRLHRVCEAARILHSRPKSRCISPPISISAMCSGAKAAGMIQDLLEDLTDDDREKLMTGLTDENFRKAWPTNDGP